VPSVYLSGFVFPLRRVAYVALALITIGGGLLVHVHGAPLGPVVRDVAGDALWAMMIAWWIGVIAPEPRLITRSAVAYALCVAVEISQLWHPLILEAARATVLGHLILGNGFDPRDFAAYAAGVAGAALLEAFWRVCRGMTS
jgi:hypothetical protein